MNIVFGAPYAYIHEQRHRPCACLTCDAHLVRAYRMHHMAYAHVILVALLWPINMGLERGIHLRVEEYLDLSMIYPCGRGVHVAL